MREPVFSFFFFFTFTRSFDLSTSLLEFRFISHAQMRNFRFCEIFTEIAFTTSCPSSPRNILFVVGWNYFYIITRFVQDCLLWQIIAEMNDALFFLSISIKQNCSGCMLQEEVCKSRLNSSMTRFDIMLHFTMFRHIWFLIPKAIGLTRGSRQ